MSVAAHLPSPLLLCPLLLPEKGHSTPPSFSQGVTGSEAAGLYAPKAGSNQGTKSMWGHGGEEENDEKMLERSLGEIVPSMVSREQIKVNQTESSPLQKDTKATTH